MLKNKMSSQVIQILVFSDTDFKINRIIIYKKIDGKWKIFLDNWYL